MRGWPLAALSPHAPPTSGRLSSILIGALRLLSPFRDPAAVLGGNDGFTLFDEARPFRRGHRRRFGQLEHRIFEPAGRRQICCYQEVVPGGFDVGEDQRAYRREHRGERREVET